MLPPLRYRLADPAVLCYPLDQWRQYFLWFPADPAVPVVLQNPLVLLVQLHLWHRSHRGCPRVPVALGYLLLRLFQYLQVVQEVQRVQ